MFGNRQADEHCREHGENIGLDKCHDALEAIHEDQHDSAEHGDAGADGDADLHGYEDNGDESQNYGVSCHHVGEKTNHQGERFGKNAKHFNDRHDGNGEF